MLQHFDFPLTSYCQGADRRHWDCVMQHDEVYTTVTSWPSVTANVTKYKKPGSWSVTVAFASVSLPHKFWPRGFLWGCNWNLCEEMSQFWRGACSESVSLGASSKSLHGHMANNSRENKTSTPPPWHPTQRLLWRCDDLWCSTRVIGFNCHTIIPLCGSKVINFPLPVLLCHADPKFKPRKLHFHQYVVEFSKKQPAKSKRDELEWRDKEHCSFTIYIECIIHSLALMWTAAGYFDPHQAP